MTHPAFPRACGVLLALSILATVSAHAGGLTFVEAEYDDTRINNNEAVAVSATHVYAAASQSKSISTWERAAGGELTFKDAKFDNDPGIDGLNGANAVAIAPTLSGVTHVYVIAENDDALSVFESNDTTGALTFLQKMQDGVGMVTSMHGPSAVTLSGDLKNVYVTSSDSVVVFTRDTANGLLTFLEAQTQNPPTITLLNRARGVAVSPDRKFLYATARVDPGANEAGSIVVFARDDTDGSLSFVQSLQNGDGSPAIQRMQGPESVVVSPDTDGKYVYVVCRGADSVLAFARNVSDGKLTFIQFQHNGGNQKGLIGAFGIAMDADSHVYVTGTGDGALSVFRSDPATGKLAILETFFNPMKVPPNPAVLQGLGGARGVAVAPGGGKHVYVAGRARSTIVAFKNDICGDNHVGIDEACDNDVTHTSGDGCSATCRLELCGATPDPGPCRTPTVPNQAVLKINNDALKEDTKDSIQWQWKTGPATAIGEYGNPVTTDDYVLCVYDATGALLMSPAAAKGGTCKKGAPCWKAPNATKFQYTDSLLTPDGLSSVQLKADDDEPKAQITFKGKGVFLGPPALPVPAPLLPLKVQARSSVTNGCWQATHGTLIYNDAKHFQMKGN